MSSTLKFNRCEMDISKHNKMGVGGEEYGRQELLMGFFVGFSTAVTGWRTDFRMKWYNNIAAQATHCNLIWQKQDNHQIGKRKYFSHAHIRLRIKTKAYSIYYWRYCHWFACNGAHRTSDRWLSCTRFSANYTKNIRTHRHLYMHIWSVSVSLYAIKYFS